MTTINADHPDQCSWVRLKVHPCKKRFLDIPLEEQEADYHDLVNCVQRHTNCSSAYCLRKMTKVLRVADSDIPLMNVMELV